MLPCFTVTDKQTSSWTRQCITLKSSFCRTGPSPLPRISSSLPVADAKMGHHPAHREQSHSSAPPAASHQPPTPTHYSRQANAPSTRYGAAVAGQKVSPSTCTPLSPTQAMLSAGVASRCARQRPTRHRSRSKQACITRLASGAAPRRLPTATVQPMPQRARMSPPASHTSDMSQWCQILQAFNLSWSSSSSSPRNCV